MTYVLVGKLLSLVTLFILFRLLLIWLTVIWFQSLPLVAQYLANLACLIIQVRSKRQQDGRARFTEADAGILLTDGVSLVVCKEHVGG